MLVLVVYLCPPSVRVVATFSGIVLFPLLVVSFGSQNSLLVLQTQKNAFRNGDVHYDTGWKSSFSTHHPTSATSARNMAEGAHEILR